MKGIKQIVTDFGIDLGDKVEDFEKAVVENYATRAELEEKVKRIETLTSQVEELGEQIKGFETTSTEIEGLQAKIKEYENAEALRAKQAEEAQALSTFQELFNQAVGERKFANSMTAEAVQGKAYEVHIENPAMSVGDILDNLTKDEDGVWANPQRATAKTPVPSNENPKAELGEFTRKLFGSRQS